MSLHVLSPLMLVTTLEKQVLRSLFTNQKMRPKAIKLWSTTWVSGSNQHQSASHTLGMNTFWVNIKTQKQEFSLWHRIWQQRPGSLQRRGFNPQPGAVGERICFCCSCSEDCSYSLDSIPGPLTSICQGCGHKKKKKIVSLLQSNKCYQWEVCFLFLFLFCLFIFLGLHPRHMEVPRLGV